MPDTPEHRAEMFSLAAKRRRMGLPIWETTLDVSDVFHKEGMPIEQLAEVIAERLRQLPLVDDDLRDLADELADTAEADDFDMVWSAIYDWMDYHRVWVKTV